MTTTPPTSAFTEGTRLANLRRAVEEPRFLLEGVGALLVQEVGARFRTQSANGVRWKTRGETRMVPNWPAILRDLKDGRNPPARRFEPAPVLIDKGAAGGLSHSFAWRILRADTVECGTVKRYADALHAGLPTYSETITEAIQQRLWELIKRLRGDVGRAEGAPERREARERRAAARDDAEVQSLREALQRHRETWKGQKLPKEERERRQRLETRVRERERQVGNVAASHSEEVTGKEAGRIAKARRRAGLAESLRWLLNPGLRGTRREIRHPARPMVGVPRDLSAKVQGMLGIRIRRGA